jgi:hypothetical protein
MTWLMLPASASSIARTLAASATGLREHGQVPTFDPFERQTEEAEN